MKQELHGRGSVAAAVGVMLGVCSCTDNTPKTITSPDPTLKIPAIRAAADANDMAQARQLVKDLESDDPAVRFYAIGALERLTGQTFGYQYFMDDEKRAAAVQTWRAWLAGWEAGQREADRK